MSGKISVADAHHPVFARPVCDPSSGPLFGDISGIVLRALAFRDDNLRRDSYGMERRSFSLECESSYLNK